MSKGMSTIEGQLAEGKSVLLFTVGDSMEPLLFHRDTHVVIVKADRKLKKGEILLYQRPSGQYVLHRITGIDGDFYYTRGDNRFVKEKVPEKWVIGVVTEIFRRGRHILVTDRNYRLYVWLWSISYPIRYLTFKVRRKIGKLRGKYSV